MRLWCVGPSDSLHTVNIVYKMYSTADVLLPYCSKGAIADRSGLYSTVEQGVTEWNMLYCNGMEATIAKCSIISTEHCFSNEVASVICQGKLRYLRTVSMIYSNEIGTVCSH